jgi:lysozyme
VLAGAAVAWFAWVPEYRPALRRGEVYGVDVSRHQGWVAWARVAADHVAFAYVKATEGADHVDARFAENWAGARDAGLARGAYHFFTLCSPGAAQAARYVSTVPRDPAALPAAVDLELAGNCDDRPPAEAVRRELDDLVTVLRAHTGRPVLLYVGDDFARRYPLRRSDPRWVPRPFRRPNGAWAVWQVQGRARVHGVTGPVDLDVGRTVALR